MVSIFLPFVGYLCFFSHGFVASGTRVQSLSNLNSDASPVTAIQLPAFSSDSSSLDSDHTFANAEKIKMHSALAQEEVDDGFDVEDYEDFKVKPTKVVGLKHQSAGKEIRPMDSVLESTAKDLNGIQTLHTSIVERKKQNIISRILLKDDSQQQAQSPSFVANIPAETWNMSWEDGFGGTVIELVLCSAWTEGTVSRSATLFS